MTFQETLQQIVNLPTETKLKMAVDSYVELLPVLAKIDTDNNGAALVCAIIGSAVGADGKISAEENAFVKALFKAHKVDLTDEQVETLVKNHSGDDWRSLISKLAHALDSKSKANLALLCAAICAIDDTITRDEAAFLAGIFVA